MSQRTTTKCDCCGAETETPNAMGWCKVNLHPWKPGELEDQGQPSEEWKMGDLCMECADKFRAWLTGSLMAVFRKPKGKKG